ncbi:urease accessory protein UreF [Paenibacillus sp. WLX1005]|uniref:urease accessory protein UreF n=1 Tax=Paenibacillus sp. WLX1005 TaxID=3243766 RepID=UPI00398411D5
MNSSQKLLAYVQLLDAKLPTASFTHAHNLEHHVQQGQIRNVDDLETYITSVLKPHLFQWEAPAIHSVYAAEAKQDIWQIALVDKMVIQQIILPEDMDEARKTGKRLLKLARNLYPWMEFTMLEQAITQYHAVLSLTVLHAWINVQLGIDREQAVGCYFYTLLSCCMSRAAAPLQLSIRDASLLTDRMAQTMENDWNTHWRTTIQSHITSDSPLHNAQTT